MRVRLFEIDEASSQFNFQVARSELETLEKRFDFEILDCQAQMIQNVEFVELRGHYQVSVKAECDFCLEPMVLDLDESFVLDLVAEGSQSELTGDIELSASSPEFDTYSGEEIILTKYFEDQLILDLPLNISCSEDCKGLCSTCGGNLNKNQCDCQEKEGISPFSILKDLKPDS